MGSLSLSLSLSLWLVLVLLLHYSWSFCSSVPPPPPIPSSHLCLPHQRDSLLHFKNTVSVYCLSTSSNPRTDSWKQSVDCCSWQGVKCHNLTGHVIGIDLSYSCLNGTISGNSTLFQLHSLQSLDLSSNFLNASTLLETGSSLFHLDQLQRLNLADTNFYGAISSELFTRLVSLTHLNLSYTQFSGFIPHQISPLPNLVSVDLSACDLRVDLVNMSDVLFTSFLNLSSSLQYLSLPECHLHGEFPVHIFQFPNLKHIDLSGNVDLTGYLPNTNLSTALEFLDLSYCSFRGHIPDVFGNLTKLTCLSFSSCNLSGPLPISIFNLPKITSLKLSYNRLEGPLPDHVTGLQLLKELGLSHNSLSGGIPSWLFSLPSLPQLDLSHNKLAGPINRIQKPSSFLQLVDLSFNDIHGPIPDSFFDLVSLTSLVLSSNNLSGVVKSDMLSKLKSLELVDLSDNRLLSLTRTGNDHVNYSFPRLRVVTFFGCSLKQFPSLFQTSKLKELDLSNNKISGGISKWQAQGWEELRLLNLSHNSLTTLEQIPGRKWLTTLDLSSNLLEGPILLNSLILRMSFPENLGQLLISENKLTGTIPSSICNLSGLELLDLSRNSLNGTIPECLGNFSFFIAFIGLHMNKLHGKIPDSFGNNGLSHILLNDNQLEGLVPPSLANSTYLQVLNLGNNKLTDRFPHWLASLPNLQVLILKSNRFHGPLPHSMQPSDFSALRILDLSINEFSGTLPPIFFQNLRSMQVVPEVRPSGSSYFNYITGGYVYYETSVNVTTKKLEMELTKIAESLFVSIDLSNNQFDGQIPEEVGQLISVRMLNLSRNNFTGPIPASFGNLVELQSLDLSSNNLGGTIPSQLTKLTFLAVLNLSSNHLVGLIPNGKQFDTFDNNSYISNLGLCGLPLSKRCGDDDHGVASKPPSPLVVTSFWKAVMMGYGSGVVLGVSIGYIVFTTGRPWWFVRKVERDWQPNFTKWIQRNRPKRN